MSGIPSIAATAMGMGSGLAKLLTGVIQGKQTKKLMLMPLEESNDNMDFQE